jgi:hypothetical protein
MADGYNGGNIMKKIIYIIAALLMVTLSSCQKDELSTVAGEWALVEASGVDAEQAEVYIHFMEDGNFALYQKFTSASYHLYKGTYTVTESVLKGTYADGSDFGTDYKVAKESGNLVLTPVGSKKPESASKYKPTTISEDVKANAVSVLTKSADYQPYL